MILLYIHNTCNVLYIMNNVNMVSTTLQVCGDKWSGCSSGTGYIIKHFCNTHSGRSD